MKRFKKYVLLLAAALPVVSLCACGDDSSKTESETPLYSQIETTVAPTVKAEAETEATKSKPGYLIPTTSPDFEENGLCYYSLSNNEVMLTQYNGTDTNIEIPENVFGMKVTVIGSNAFQNKNIESVTIPSSVTEISKYAFSGCQSLKEINVPEGVQIIGANAFWNCRRLKKVQLPASLKEIGDYAFSATGISSVTIPESSTYNSIGDKVFFQCFDLSEVIIPATITTISDTAFDNCSPDLAFSAPAGSYGESYAKSHGYKLK